MEFIQGVSLQQRVEEEGMLRPGRAIRIMIQVCEALEEAHGKGVLHRDIKPGNLLMEDNLDRVRIADFGIAQELRPGTSAIVSTDATAAGTRPFMSSEQEQSRELDGRTDIFSLGMTSYFMLTGRLAANARSSLGPPFLFKEQEFVPPSRFNRQVSPALDRVVLKTIATERKHRYPSCGAVLDDLRPLGEARATRRQGLGILGWNY